MFQQSGGPQSREKAEWLAQVLENWFYENKDLEAYEVANFLEEIIGNEFNLTIDDGSPMEIARTVCDYFAICSTSNEDTVRIKLQMNGYFR